MKTCLKNKVMVLDGAMGTMIQRYALTEKDFRGELFSKISLSQQGNNDILSLTQPHIIKEIHQKYLEAGADIIETNTFSANAVSQQDYGLEKYAYELNKQAALTAKQAVKEYEKKYGGQHFVAGSIGPTNRTASISPDVEMPEYRNINFDELADAYADQIKGLIDGGADLLIIETVFDTLNAKAALVAAQKVFEEKIKMLPVIVSATVTDKSGRTLSGQTLEAFITSVDNENVISLGLNCSFGAKDLIPYINRLSPKLSKYLAFYPNAGLPNELGNYDETPAQMQSQLEELLKDKKLNIVGGCCGTTPEHIRAIAEIAGKASPREIPGKNVQTSISGLEELIISKEKNFVNIGERTNVAGSRKFARLIKEKKYEEAIEIARTQIENGAQIIDICMDDAMLDTKAEMEIFLKYMASEPDIAKVPVMIDSSRWEVIEAGLKWTQGKSIVNSISLKDGEDEFIRKAKLIKQYGAVTVVMAFDENGQATEYKRKIEICERAYRILIENLNFLPQDIIFDPNILTIATGIEEHANYAVDYLKAVKWIKENLPHAKVSGGVSNLSFAFRGNNTVREAMHAVFLYHAVKAGMDMGIVNPALLMVYEDIPKELLTLVENVIFNKNFDYANAVERLIRFAEKNKTEKTEKKDTFQTWREKPLRERIIHALIKGIAENIEEDVEEIRHEFEKAFDVVDEVLMEGMRKVGELFSDGKMFLPQVVKSARVMKKAVSFLQPFIEDELQSCTEKNTKSGKIVMATVKGDVHDIGKNIVGLVLSCNNFEIIDLGVMVPAAEILETAKREKADAIGLSGLITPSLDEMTFVASEMERQKISVPLVLGGATTSKLHTAVKVEPNYSRGVIHVKDASQSVGVFKQLCDKKTKSKYLNQIEDEYNHLRGVYNRRKEKKYYSLQEARKNKFSINWDQYEPIEPAIMGTKVFQHYPIEEIVPFIDWTFFFLSWGLKGRYPVILENEKYKDEATKLLMDGQQFLKKISDEKQFTAKALINFSPANTVGDDIIVYDSPKTKNVAFKYHTLRCQEQKKENLALSDFLLPQNTGKLDYIGSFLTSIHGAEELSEKYKNKKDDYKSIMTRILADRLAEAFAEMMHFKTRTEHWAYAPDENLQIDEILKEKYQGIRPAFGYPSLPDQSEIYTFFNQYKVQKNIGNQLTEHFMMQPAASVCGLYFAHPASKYFGIGKIEKEQVKDYAKRKNMEMDTIEKYLSKNLNY